MKEGLRVQGGNTQGGLLLGGEPIREFSDIRAAPFRAVGVIITLVGIALFAVGPDPDNVRNFGLAMAAVGVTAFLFGTWRKSNRVLVCAEGFAHVKRGKVDAYLWQDIQEIVIRQEIRYHVIEMVFSFATFHNSCKLRLLNGDLLEVNLPPISEQALQAIQKSWEERSLVVPPALGASL